MRSISGAEEVRIGMTTTTSPNGRSSTPASTAAWHTRRPQRRPSLGGASSTPAIRPQTRTSETAGDNGPAGAGDRPAVRLAPHVGQDVPFLEQVQVAQGDRCGQSITREAVAVIEGLGAQILAQEGVGDPASCHRGAHRQIARRQPLADRHQVGSQSALLGREQGASAAEPGGHLVAHQQDTGVLAGVTELPYVVGGGHIHARCTLHERLDHHRGQLRRVLG